MATPYQTQEEFLVTPLTFSILITSPIRRNVSFSPVSAVLFPLARVKLPYAGFVVAALDIFISFLIKRSLVKPPQFPQAPLSNHSPTLTMEQLWELLQTYQGHISPTPFPKEQLNSSPREDEPLFPENLTFALSLTGPLKDFGSFPDSSFNVPLFELPGTPGNLIISFVTLLAQLILELTPLSSNTSLGGESS